MLDIGTFKIACLVLKFDETDISPRRRDRRDGGAGGFRVIGAATTRSRGVRFGEIDTVQETERAIRTAVQAAQKMAQYPGRSRDCRFRARGRAPTGWRARSRMQTGTVAGWRHRLGPGGLRSAGYRRAARGAARPAGELRARSSHGPVRSARPCGQPLSVDMHLLTVEAGAIETLAALREALRSGTGGVASAPMSGPFQPGGGRAGTGRGLHRHGRRVNGSRSS
jgi:cell division protein FtsA